MSVDYDDRDSLLHSFHSADHAHSVPGLNGPVYLTRGSINSDTNSMSRSYYSEGDYPSYNGSTDSVSNSYLASNTAAVNVYGAMALSPTGSESRVLLSDFDAFPVSTTCKKCKQDVSTKVRYKRGKLTWLSSGILALLFCGLGCWLIPCCVSSLKDVVHECPNCGTVLGTYKRKTSCMS